MSIVDEQNIFESDFIPAGGSNAGLKAKIDSSFPKYKQRAKIGSFVDTFESKKPYDISNTSDTELKNLGKFVTANDVESFRKELGGNVNLDTFFKVIDRLGGLKPVSYDFQNKLSQMR